MGPTQLALRVRTTLMTERIEESAGAFAARAVPLVAVGALVGGPIGAVAAAVAVAATFRRPTGLVAGGAAVALVVAALATVLEVPVDSDALRSSYALDRPVAAGAGMVAALFALVSVVTLALRERAPRAASDEPLDHAPEEAAAPSLRARLAGVERHAPLLAVVTATGVALILLAPSPPAATLDVADSVRLGLGWGSVGESGVTVDGTEPPLPVIVAAVAPGGPELWTGAAGAGAAALVAAVISRRREGRAALVGAALVGVGLVLGRADLAAALAALSLAATVSLGDPLGRTSARAVGAGVAFGAAVLCVPVLGLALPVLVALLVVDPATRQVTAGHASLALVGAVVVIAPWQRWVVERFSTWLPAAELELPVAPLIALAVVAVALAVAHSRRLPGLSST